MTMLKSILILTVSVLSASSAAYAADKEAITVNPVSALTSQTVVNAPELTEKVAPSPIAIVQPSSSENNSAPGPVSLSRTEKIKKFFSKMLICCKTIEDDIPKIEQAISTASSDVKQITQNVNDIVNNVNGLVKK